MSSDILLGIDVKFNVGTHLNHKKGNNILERSKVVNKSYTCTCSIVLKLNSNKTNKSGQGNQNSLRHFTLPYGLHFLLC
jgi:hypothetical protein